MRECALIERDGPALVRAVLRVWAAGEVERRQRRCAEIYARHIAPREYARHVVRKVLEGGGVAGAPDGAAATPPRACCVDEGGGERCHVDGAGRRPIDQECVTDFRTQLQLPVARAATAQAAETGFGGKRTRPRDFPGPGLLTLNT